MNKKREILNIARTNTLDVVAVDKENSKLIMPLTDGIKRHNERKHLLLLQDKINNCIGYIESEQYLKSY